DLLNYQLKLVEELRQPVILCTKARRAPVTLEVFDVAARRKGPARAGEDDHADLFIRLNLVKQAREIFAHRFVDRIEPVGAIKGDRGDAIFQLKEDGLVVHISDA